MTRPAGFPQSCDELGQSRCRCDAAIGNRLIDPRQVLHHHPTCSEVEMSHLGIAHLTIRESDVETRGSEEGMRVA